MADLHDGPARSGDPAIHDGRFGERFDDEISNKAVVQGLIWITVVCALGILITWGFLIGFNRQSQATQPPPSPIAEANERRLPQGPLLQASPEAELEQMRHEMSEHLNGYGWIDETGGVVHIPIDRAIDLLAERGLATAAGESTGETAPDEPAAAEDGQ